MDFREILLIASKGQGVNQVPVSARGCCRRQGVKFACGRWNLGRAPAGFGRLDGALSWSSCGALGTEGLGGRQLARPEVGFAAWGLELRRAGERAAPGRALCSSRSACLRINCGPETDTARALYGPRLVACWVLLASLMRIFT